METSLYELDDLEFQVQLETNGDDGSYTMYIIPGEYDLILERLGFLAHVLTGITINENDVIDLENKILIEGDIDRDGVVGLMDLVEVVDRLDTADGDGIYDERCDYGQKGFIDLTDMVIVVDNMDQLITIEEYM
ncbi:MAG: carboxypeptidase regulatory-like domain-containing protein [Clostridia bacterium]|nr:carboxypeptidase regulatory-like domain-containing protein [Clostridia bacterium]MCI9274511.1 carboxypeptidase regulatory-like domain-containing protein [Clostridia bacterium]